MEQNNNNEVLRAFQQDITEMMEEQFEERVAIIQDPETGEETLHKINGDDISETEYFALTYFELGWNSALRSFERMSISLLEDVVEATYPDEGDKTFNDIVGGPD